MNYYDWMREFESTLFEITDMVSYDLDDYEKELIEKYWNQGMSVEEAIDNFMLLEY